MKFKIIAPALALCILLLASSPSLAEEPQATSLTLKEAIAKGLSQNSLMQSLEEDKKSAAAQVTQTRSALLPKLTLDASWIKQSMNFVPFPPSPAFSTLLTGIPYDTYSVTLGASQILYGKEKLYNSVTSSQLSQEISQLDYLRARQDVSLQIIRGYFDVLKATKEYDIAKELLNQSQDHLKLAQRLEEAGTGTHLGVLSAQLQVANGESNQIKAENNRDLAQRNFNYILNESFDKSYSLQDDEPSPSDQSSLSSLEQLRQTALKNREELTILQKRMESLRLTQAGIQSEMNPLPTVSLQGQYSLNGYTSAVNMPNWMAAVVAHWSVFDGFKFDGQLDEINSQLKKAELLQEDTQKRILLEVERAYLTIASEEKRVISTLAAQKLAEEKYRLEEEKYKVGMGTDTDIMDAQTLLFQAKTLAVEARYDYLYAIAAAKRSIGEL